VVIVASMRESRTLAGEICPVTGLGWLGLAQPMRAELDPAQKNIKNKKQKS